MTQYAKPKELPLFSKKRIHINSSLSFIQHESSGKGATYRLRIYALLMRAERPMTDREIMQSLGTTEVNNVRPEITRLKDRGMLVEAGKTKCKVTGKTVRTVEIVRSKE